MDCSPPWSFPVKNTGLPFPSPGDPPYPGPKPSSPVTPALAGSFFTTTATWEAQFSLQPFDLLSILIIIIVSCCYGLNLCFPQIYMLRP